MSFYINAVYYVSFKKRLVYALATRVNTERALKPSIPGFKAGNSRQMDI